ncbi:MAG: hypothetical protein HWN67_03805 [Candidatus Helarchaeota archaeon]|nr:hypothetical protein [Candidatus Helarchaeota archaeon]
MEDDILTVVFVRQSGKIRSIKVEVKKLFYLAAGLISLILAFIGLLYGYVFIYRENSDLLAMVEKIERDERIISSEESYKSDILEERAAGEIIKLKEIEEEAREEIAKEPQKDVVENLEGKTIDVFSTDSDSCKVTVEDFQVEKSDKIPGIKVIFKIINVNQISKITGYWILVVEDKKKRTVVYRSFPNTTLNNKGEIVDYKSATLTSTTWFSIERFKIVKAEFEFDGEFDDYDSIYIYIYSIKGELLLKSKYNRWSLTA